MEETNRFETPIKSIEDLQQSRQNTMAAPNPVDFIAQDIKRKEGNKVKDSLSLLQEQSNQASNVISIFGSPQDEKISLTEEVGFDEVYAQVGDKFVPRFENFLKGTDNNERLARQQSTSDKWINGLSKAGVNALTTVAGSTIGAFTGAYNAISQGEWSGLYTDDFNTWLDELNQELRYKLPNYYTKQEQNLNFGQSLTTANFLANDLPGGISFTLGAIVGEGIWAAVTGGASLSTTAARWGLRASKLGKIVKGINDYKKINQTFLRKGYARSIAEAAQKKANIYGKTADFLNTARFTYTSAGYEAGVEARHFMKESEENFIHYYETTFGRKPTPAEMSKFKEDNVSAGNSLYVANLALVGGSNLAVFGRMFDLKNPLSNSLKGFGKAKNRILYGLGTETTEKGGRELIKATTLQKIAGRTRDFAKAPLIEGFWEEGNQSVAGNYANDWVASGYDLQATRDNYNMMGGLYDSYAKTYGSKEGWKEIGIGMIVGLLGGAASGGLNQYGKQKKEQEAIVDLSKRTVGLAETLKQDSVGSTIFADRMASMNRINKATQDQQEAISRGDKTAEELARQRALLANIDMNKKYDRLDEAYEDLKTSLDLVDSNKWAEELGVDTQAIEDYKSQVLKEYQSLSEEYSSNKDFADLIVGRNSTTKDLKNKDAVTQAIAYNMTIGTKALENSNMFLDEMTIEFAKNVSPEKSDEINTALKARSVLESATKQNREEFFKAKKKREQVKKQKKSLEDQILNINKKLATQSQEQKQGQQQKLTDLAQRLEEINTLEQTLEQEYLGAYAIIREKNPLSTENASDVITAEELDKVLQINEKGEVVGGTLADIDAIIKAQEETNPKRAEKLKKLFTEYQKSLYAYKEYNKTIQGIANENFNPANLVTALEKSIAGITKREANEFTKEFFANVGNQLAKDSLEVMQEKQATTEVKPEVTEGDYTKLQKAIKTFLSGAKNTREEFELMKNYPKLTRRIKQLEIKRKSEKRKILKNVNKDFLLTAPQKKSFIQKRQKEIDKKYDDIIKNLIENRNIEDETEIQRLEGLIEQTTKENNLISEYIGEEDAKKEKPTKRNIERLTELQTKLQGTRFFNTNEILEGDPKELEKEAPLTAEEIEELQRVNKKLSDWQVMEGTMVLGVNSSLADLITRLVQLKTTVEKNKKEQQTKEDYINIEQASEKNSSATRNDIRALQTLNGVYIKILGNTVALSHVDVTTLLNKYMKGEVSKIELKKANSKKKIDIDITQLEKYQKVQGNTFYVTVGEEVISFSIGQSNRINFATNTWNSIKDSLSLQFLTEQEIDPQAKNNSYIMGYEILEDGSVIPAKSDFTVENGLGELTPEELKKVEKLFLYLDPKDAYNKKLLAEYNKAVKSNKEENIKKALEALEANVGISLLSEDKFAGFLRAGLDNNSSTPTAVMFAEIRKRAAKKLIENQGNNLINLEAIIPVNFKYNGSPVFKLKEVNGELVVDNQEIGTRELQYIKDAGYVENGELVIGGKVSKENVSTVYLPKNEEKTPVIVFNYQGDLIAFPVNLKTGSVDKTAALYSIVEENINMGAKINKINDLLIQNGIEPKAFNLNEENIYNRTDLEEALRNVKITPNIDKWTTKDFNINDLSFEATLPIDITNKPFNSPKVIMDVKNATTSQPQDFREQAENSQAELADKLMDYVTEINANYGKYPENAAFTEALDDTEQLPSRQDIEPLRGVEKGFAMKGKIIDILDRLVNNYKLTKEIKQLHPAGFFENLKKDINQFKNLKGKITALNQQIKDQIKDKQNQDC